MGALRPCQRLGYRGCHCEPASQRWCGNPPDIPGTLIGFVDDALIVPPHTPSTYAIGAMRASPPTSSIRRLPQSALIRLALAGDARVTFPRGECFGKRIATPVCGLVRNDMRYTEARRKTIPLQSHSIKATRRAAKIAVRLVSAFSQYSRPAMISSVRVSGVNCCSSIYCCFFGPSRGLHSMTREIFPAMHSRSAFRVASKQITSTSRPQT